MSDTSGIRPRSAPSQGGSAGAAGASSGSGMGNGAGAGSDEDYQREPDTPMAHYPERLGMEMGGAGVGAGVGGGAGAGPGTFPAFKEGRWGVRRYGLPLRAWLALAIVLGFVMLTRIFVPSGSSNPTVDEINKLVPRNYLNNTSTDPAPFDFCPVFGPGDAIAARRGQFELLRSRVHMGSGARIQRVLRKAFAGEPTSISVIGGSVSACHGAGDDLLAPECYPARLYNWWNTVFPHPGNELTNGATKLTDSAYYAYCSKNHLPDATDLVIIEFDTADNNDPEWLEYFELLVRSILVRPDQPAVLILGHFSPQIQAHYGYMGPDQLHTAVAQFYDLPHISAKGLIYDSYFEKPDRVLADLYVGSHLSNKDGHDLIADVLISYLMSQICESWSAALGYTYTVPEVTVIGDVEHRAPGGNAVPFGGLGVRPDNADQQPEAGEDDNVKLVLNPAFEVPPMRLKDRPSNMESFREVEPFCVSAADLVNPLPPSIFYGSGWVTVHPPAGSSDDRHYWYAEQPTSSLRVPLRIGAGDVGIYFLQVPMDQPAGSVSCWVDDNKDGQRTLLGNADTKEPIATLVMIDKGVAKGSHFVTCQLDGEPGGPPTPFKLLGIFTT